MRILDKEVLDEFVGKHPDAVNPVNRWIEIAENNDFKDHNSLKSLFPSADYVGNSRYVFNIKGNRYRFIILIVFISGVMQIRFCGTYAEYDKIKDPKML